MRERHTGFYGVPLWVSGKVGLAKRTVINARGNEPCYE